jgi:hypothetical protein
MGDASRVFNQGSRRFYELIWRSGSLELQRGDLGHQGVRVEPPKAVASGDGERSGRSGACEWIDHQAAGGDPSCRTRRGQRPGVKGRRMTRPREWGFDSWTIRSWLDDRSVRAPCHSHGHHGGRPLHAVR